MTAPTGDPTTAPPGQWQAVHVFYAANPQPLLVDCVDPLVRELTADGLLAGYFFINYWLEGPHVRLRLRPSSPAATEAVRDRAATAIEAFLRQRPALYAMGHGFLGELYNTLFALEFPDGPPADLVGPDGRMRLQPNNSYSFRQYEPEYGKYGGPAGVALAEWHFQRSSDVVLHAIRTMNLHMRPILFGVATQLMMVMAGTFIPDRAELVGYLDRYHAFWRRSFAGTNFIGAAEYEKMYASMAPALRARFVATLDALDSGQVQRLPGFLRGWAEHCAELRSRVCDLAARGELSLDSWDGSGPGRVTDPDAAVQTLLSPYLHMTNNRFHVTIRDEAYLAYLLGRALGEATEPQDVR
ncbi:thiopeptide-type bacteriocin biosynthesis protein [Plantactinospora mayteni]|uniref:Lantibiotic biosynthesis protein n=1 Tax=Plantactinospora mayteni TaxID=566021 RepID=A0ABQ4F240_9ACTN|nr:lantibiotic dehydratase C-terminal domain-containing protein [Plantactinospora mayteni]GIH00969.1 lantibiotic biosynthesis protein [Plantactinospora mayteni]